ncbi:MULTISPECIES: hypothetical protein [unclassified Duganella]|uniref:hypothetical protein n=1 Tax=unclassified Duganella TaxID=2636909 RepID=UPI0011C0CA71|nr:MULTISPECIES: hypothetical protein [unclassified Duganella]
MSFRYRPTRFSEYHDTLVSVLLQSPNRFKSFDDSNVDQKEALREAFEGLQKTFPLVEKKLKDEYLAAILRELLRMAYEFYSSGDSRNGAYALQEVEGTVWPSRNVPPRHALDAECRVHGTLKRYAGKAPNPYPYPGSVEDMGHSQLQLFSAVLRQYEDGSETLQPGDEHNWLLGPDTIARKFNAQSKKAAATRFTQELSTRTSLAALRATSVFGSLLIFDIEETHRPRISVRGKPELFKTGSPNFIVEEAIWTAKPAS